MRDNALVRFTCPVCRGSRVVDKQKCPKCLENGEIASFGTLESIIKFIERETDYKLVKSQPATAKAKATATAPAPNRRLAFTGHRDSKTNQEDLEFLIKLLNPDLCLNGGAQGFDTQALRTCDALNIPSKMFLPDYDTYGKVAPLRRNDAMIAEAHGLIACWDGRLSGGTFYTIRKAIEKGMFVFVVAVE